MLITFAAFVLLLTAVSLWSVLAPVQAATNTIALSTENSDDDEDEEFESFAWEPGDLRPTEK